MENKEINIQTELEKLKENYVETTNMKSQHNMHLASLKRFIFNFTPEKFGYRYGDVRDDSDNEWIEKTESLSQKVKELLDPIKTLKDKIEFLEEDDKELIKAIETKNDKEFDKKSFYQSISALVQKNASETYKKNSMLSISLLYLAKRICNSNKHYLNQVNLAISSYDKQSGFLNQEIAILSDEVQLEKSRADFLCGQQSKDFSLSIKIEDIKLKLYGIECDSKYKTGDIKAKHNQELNDIEDKIKTCEKEFEYKDKIEELEEKNEKLKDENRQLNRKLSAPTIFRCKNKKKDSLIGNFATESLLWIGSVATGCLLATSIIAAGHVIPPLVKNFDEIKGAVLNSYIKQPNIEQDVQIDSSH